MGMLVGLFLIAVNVYNSVKGPPGRGFSYIETWNMGTQFPILLALVEYGLVLAWKRLVKHEEDKTQATKIHVKPAKSALTNKNSTMDDKIQLLDMGTFLLSVTFFLFFNVFYWSLA